jgi:hypothetical protein
MRGQYVTAFIRQLNRGHNSRRCECAVVVDHLQYLVVARCFQNVCKRRLLKRVAGAFEFDAICGMEQSIVNCRRQI